MSDPTKVAYWDTQAHVAQLHLTAKVLSALAETGALPRPLIAEFVRGSVGFLAADNPHRQAWQLLQDIFPE